MSPGVGAADRCATRASATSSALKRPGMEATMARADCSPSSSSWVAHSCGARRVPGSAAGAWQRPQKRLTKSYHKAYHKSASQCITAPRGPLTPAVLRSRLAGRAGKAAWKLLQGQALTLGRPPFPAGSQSWHHTRTCLLRSTAGKTDHSVAEASFFLRQDCPEL